MNYYVYELNNEKKSQTVWYIKMKPTGSLDVKLHDNNAVVIVSSASSTHISSNFAHSE